MCYLEQVVVVYLAGSLDEERIDTHWEKQKPFSFSWTVIRATTFPQFMGNFCSLIKTKLRIAANVIYVSDKGIQMES